MTKLAVREWGSGERVAVLIHGLTSDSRSWWRFGPELAGRGYRVVAVDLPGHGASPRLPEYTVDGLIDSLLDSVPARPALALGHSFGGWVLGLAEDRLAPDRVAYEDPAWPPADPALRPVMEAQRGWTLDQVAAEFPRWPAEARQHKHAAMRDWDPRTLEIATAHVPFEPATPARPSLVIVPDSSWLIPPGRVAELRSAGHEVRIVPGAGHNVHNDDFPAFVAALDGWL